DRARATRSGAAVCGCAGIAAPARSARPAAGYRGEPESYGRTRARSPGPRPVPCQLGIALADAVAALLVVAERVEARAGGREKDALPRPGCDNRALHRFAQHLAALDVHRRLEDFGEPRPGLADRVRSGDIVEVGRAFVEIVALRQAAANPVDALV